ncbi:hypothetical protein GH721_03250 [Kriegella sp. EG-1]|nr:hypothetical protein [Flavobacteriaceae bacterium EG-1]
MESLSKKRKPDGSSLSNNGLFKLKRANNEINLLSNKLKSYTYEPCTYSLHQKFQSLKQGMEDLKKGNDELISSVEQGNTIVDDISEKVMEQIRAFNELRMGIFDYSNLVKTH